VPIHQLIDGRFIALLGLGDELFSWMLFWPHATIIANEQKFYQSPKKMAKFWQTGRFGSEF
jgi:hypothetical protein